MNTPIYPGPLRLGELQDRVASGSLERVTLHPDPFHGGKIGGHVDVKTWETGCDRPTSFKVQDPIFARHMSGDIEI